MFLDNSSSLTHKVMVYCIVINSRFMYTFLMFAQTRKLRNLSVLEVGSRLIALLSSSGIFFQSSLEEPQCLVFVLLLSACI